MKISKDSLLTLYNILSDSSKLADSMTIIDRQMALTIPSGFVILNASDIDFNISIADIKHHAKILKLFITAAKLKNKTYLIEDEIDQVTFIIHKLKYSMKKPLLSKQTSIEKMIHETEQNELGSGTLDPVIISELQSILKINKDTIIRVDVGFTADWELSGFRLYLSDIDTPIELNMLDFDESGDNDLFEYTYFNVDFMELPTKSEIVYNVYAQDDELTPGTIAIRFKFDEKALYRDFRYLPIDGSVF